MQARNPLTFFSKKHLITVAITLGSLLISGPAFSAKADKPGNSNYHNFHYNAKKQSYQIKGLRIPEADVKRDLAGALCSKCHASEVGEVKNSVHYTLAARTDRVMFPGGGAHGMLDRACGLPGTSGLINYTSDVNLGECGKCHTGRYPPVMEGAFASMFQQMGLPEPAQQAQHIVESGIDCLICHAETYKSVPSGDFLQVSQHAAEDGASPSPLGYARAAHDNGDFDQDGIPDAQIDLDGDGVLDMPMMMDTDGDSMPDTPWPTIAQDRSPEAVLSIGPTTTETCLRCHEHARTGYKRATLFEEGYDVHASADIEPFTGSHNRCTVCHTASDHKFVRGHNVGGDLAAADYPPPPPGVVPDPDDPTNIMCTTCHRLDEIQQAVTGSDKGKQKAAGKKGSVHDQRHLESIACETCHIPYSGGITYSLYGDGAHISFGRNAEGKDTKLITADHMRAEDAADIAADYTAYQALPALVWYNGGVSFLAQSLSVRGSPGAMITPFKPMANGMVFDARFFDEVYTTNAAGAPYNAHSMYRFYANQDSDTGMGNAEVFYAMDMSDLTPEEVRNITLMDFMSPDPDRQAMAMMQIFPNMINFDKASYGYEHYMISSNLVELDADANGILDTGKPFHFDLLEASNIGLMKFMGFNGPMGLPADYQWYPFFGQPSDLVTMKLPDGSLMKMFMQMQAAQLPPEAVPAYLAAVENYPAFSNGVTLGGHGVRPKEEALGAGNNGCISCHGSNGIMTQPIPVTEKVPLEMGDMGVLEFPKYQWRYYNMHQLVDLGLLTENEEVVELPQIIDIEGNADLVKTSSKEIIINWFSPKDPRVTGYVPAQTEEVLTEVGLSSDQLSSNGGSWMPVLEPIVKYAPNYAVLGYTEDEIIWKGKRNSNAPKGNEKGKGGKN
jgi:hypothetical protein